MSHQEPERGNKGCPKCGEPVGHNAGCPLVTHAPCCKAITPENLPRIPDSLLLCQHDLKRAQGVLLDEQKQSHRLANINAALRSQLAAEQEKLEAACKVSQDSQRALWEAMKQLAAERKLNEEMASALKWAQEELAAERKKGMIPIDVSTWDDGYKCGKADVFVQLAAEREKFQPLVDALKESNGVLKLVYHHDTKPKSEAIGEVIDRNEAALAQWKEKKGMNGKFT